MNYQRAYEKQKELIEFYEKKLSIGEIHSAWDIKSELASLEFELQAIEAEEEAQPELKVPSEEVEMETAMEDLIEMRELLQKYEIYKAIHNLNNSGRTYEDIIDEFIAS